ncbi:hypothetical protein [Sphingobacterium multivorum]|uniref:Uncharacterized protein n=1 Tax=Sphingobacterium multivorum TaxID=28454 RepID=A0A2X2J1T4_SPHMU|nr:hypothetical protein [Sphingobacterium multivorum]QRQ61130.1 hypothetical protein I6J33_24030 [Sphingobacterium multivorum]SPZ88327.1 Uncharacterised protein [Sphingobacterium multivorum]
MNKFIFSIVLLLLGYNYCAKAQNANHYFQTTVTFPVDYKIGDYIEFASANPIAAGASGYYEVSISYDRGYMAAAATYIVSSSHSNPSRWLEAGRINNNVYTSGGLNFTIDHNPGTKSFRIRAVNTFGAPIPLSVDIKIRSINFNVNFSTFQIFGHESNEIGLLPMTYDWDLIVGNTFTYGPWILAIKAISNGNVGIGTPNPTEKLAVNGTIRAKEIKVEANPWPDYVFNEDHQLMPLDSLASFVKENKHLPNIAPAKAVEENGVALGDLNRQLLHKIEEKTLYLIQQNKGMKTLNQEIESLRKEIDVLKLNR